MAAGTAPLGAVFGVLSTAPQHVGFAALTVSSLQDGELEVIEGSAYRPFITGKEMRPTIAMIPRSLLGTALGCDVQEEDGFEVGRSGRWFWAHEKDNQDP